MDDVTQLGVKTVREHGIEVTDDALTRLSKLQGFDRYGPPDPREREGVVSFNLGDLHPHDIGTVLDHHGVAFRAGHHCTQPLMRTLGVSGTARASFYVYNTPEEVDVLVEALEATRDFFKR